MFSREASKRLREEFWVAFGKSYPRKWIRYHTGIKGLSLKFHFERRFAMVSLDIESDDLEQRIRLWEKLLALQTILLSEYLPKAVFDDSFVLPNQKEISRIHTSLPGVSIHNKDTWQETMIFLSDRMNMLETFFIEFKDILED